MLLEEDSPRKPPQPRKLDPMSVSELQVYVKELQAEIERAQSEIAKKSSSRAAAESFFKMDSK